MKRERKGQPETPVRKPRIVAYLNERRVPEELDTQCLTHVNYAFGWVLEDRVELNRPEELVRLADLRDEKGGFKLLLSLQQRDSGAFCRRSLTQIDRRLLARQCRDLIEEYRLDGIDVDLEYPGIEQATGLDNCPTCRDDFIQLLEEIRQAIGEHLLTFACGATPDTQRHVDFTRAARIVDFINVMGYDYNWGQLGSAHHSNLYPSSVGAGDHEQCGDRCIQTLLAQNVPPEKLTLGLPFYAYQIGLGSEGSLLYPQVMELLRKPGYELRWDEAAHQSYVTENGEFFAAFDDPRTIAEKAAYANEKQLGGLMYWAYVHDDEAGTLRHAVHDALLGGNH